MVEDNIGSSKRKRVGDNIGYIASHTASTNNNNLMMPTPSSTQLSISRHMCLAQAPREELITSSSQRLGSKPFRSKNKPESYIEFKKNMEAAINMETILIEIPSGENIVEALIIWARNHQSSITVLKASGLVADVTLINSESGAPPFPIKGISYMMSLSGTYLNPYCGTVPPRFTTNPVFSSFSICLSSQVFGRLLTGIVGGTIRAVDCILVTVALLKKSQFYRLTTLNGKFLENEEHVEPESNNN